MSLKLACGARSRQRTTPSRLTASFGDAKPSLPTEIGRIASAFVALQDARHDADYDVSKTFSRPVAQGLAAQADTAFTDWRIVSADPAHADMCDLFLATLLLGDRWSR